MSLESRLAKLEAKRAAPKNDYWQQFRGLSFADFWERIGKPEKNGILHEIHPYEKEYMQALAEHKYIWIKKSTGLGISEFTLRYMAWLCLKDDFMKGKKMCIVTGPRIDLAETLIHRMRMFFSIAPKYTQTEVWLNGCYIAAYPSHHLDAMRGLTDVKFVFLDEADFFPPGQQEDARHVSERYIAKSDPHIVMVSTPNLPAGLFASIETEEDCIYHRMFMPYTVGLGTIYTQEEIDNNRRSPSFEREYNLQYGYGLGNVFTPEQIEAAIQSYDYENVLPKHTKSLGIDAGFGSSKTAFVLTSLWDGKAHVLHASEFARPDFNDMVQHAMELITKYGIDKLYVDAANPELIKALKRVLGERTDFDVAMKQNDYYERTMKVVPVSFIGNSIGEKNSMITWAQQVASERQLEVHPDFKDLIAQMRSASTNEKGALDKTAMSMDLIDGLFLSLRRWHY